MYNLGLLFYKKSILSTNHVSLVHFFNRFQIPLQTGQYLNKLDPMSLDQAPHYSTYTSILCLYYILYIDIIDRFHDKTLNELRWAFQRCLYVALLIGDQCFWQNPMVNQRLNMYRCSLSDSIQKPPHITVSREDRWHVAFCIIIYIWYIWKWQNHRDKKPFSISRPECTSLVN